MRTFCLLITFFNFASIFVYSQPETGKKSTLLVGFPILAKPEIKPIIEKPATSNPFSNPNPDNNEPLYKSTSSILDSKKQPSFVIGDKRDNILEPKTAFINPNLDVLDKLNGVGKAVSENFKAIRGNQELGNFKLDSKFVNIRYRDFGEVDGDEIQILVNGRIIQGTVILEGFFKTIEIDLLKGFNKIDFEALNQGTVGPNTAEFQVFDDTGKLVSSNQWNLVTGFKASIMVVKE